MPTTSKTGLLPSVYSSETSSNIQKATVNFPKFSTPAPFVLRPFAGVYNPFPYGCSVLCNHPADYEAKDVVRRAKETWAQDGRALTAGDGLNHLRDRRASHSHHDGSGDDQDHGVPEELFRKYTDTDSRPITPAPTVASMVTRSSQARRCVTPDPISTQPGKEKTLLVLDLRRSHSQETLNWVGGPIPTTVLQPPTRTPSRSASSIGLGSPPLSRKKKLTKGRSSASSTRPTEEEEVTDPETEASLKLKQQVLSSVKTLTVADNPELTDRTGASSGDELTEKRRGKKKKKGKRGSRDVTREGEREFQGIQDPGETQVSTLGESRVGSTRPSLTPGMIAENEPLAPNLAKSPMSFLPQEILRQLQRQLDQEDVESEFDDKRKIALEEALRTLPPPKQRHQCEDLKLLKKQLRLHESKTEKWFSVARVFSRRSARFEVPMDRRSVASLTCLDYARNSVFPSSERLVLFNQVFNLHREEMDEDEQEERTLLGKNLKMCLEAVMGRLLLEEEIEQFYAQLGITLQSVLDFRTFSGVAALCERLLGSPPPAELDPPNTLEQADFRCLERIVSDLSPDSALRSLLFAIRDK